MTLIELLFTLVIVSTLAGISIPAYRDAARKAQTARAVADLRTLSDEISIYNLAYGRFPNSLADVDRGNLLDPYGNPYQYLNIADGHPPKGKMRKDRFLVPINSDFDLYSMGPDGKSVTPLTAATSRDDIIRANDGGYFGVAADY
jgi:general secretion pathway protein G